MKAKIPMVTNPGPVTWDGLKDELLEFPKETLVEMINIWVKTYWTLQNYWMVFTEKSFGFENAAKMDDMVWKKLGPAQGSRLIKTLNLGNDVPSLAMLIKYAAIQWVGSGFEWEFTEIKKNRLAMVVHKCPMGTYRKAQNLELLPCKNTAPSLYEALAKMVNAGFITTCVHAHPDPPQENIMCQWEFVLGDQS